MQFSTLREYRAFAEAVSPPPPSRPKLRHFIGLLTCFVLGICALMFLGQLCAAYSFQREIDEWIKAGMTAIEAEHAACNAAAYRIDWDKRHGQGPSSVPSRCLDPVVQRPPPGWSR
jgi:hypothetical protein